MASIGDIEIPGTVAFLIIAAMRYPVVGATKLGGFTLPPIKKAAIKEAASRVLLPAICGNCLRPIGTIEGGKLAHNCHKCRDYPSVFWDRIGGLDLGEWGTDAVACAVLGENLAINPYNFRPGQLPTLPALPVSTPVRKEPSPSASLAIPDDL